MTRQTIINEYFKRNYSGEYITIENLIKSKKMTKKELIDFCKKECIWYHEGLTEKMILDRVIDNISYILYTIICCK